MIGLLHDRFEVGDDGVPTCHFLCSATHVRLGDWSRRRVKEAYYICEGAKLEAMVDPPGIILSVIAAPVWAINRAASCVFWALMNLCAAALLCKIGPIVAPRYTGRT